MKKNYVFVGLIIIIFSIGIFILLKVYCSQQNTQIQQGECGDGICNEIEKNNNLCPEDCNYSVNNNDNTKLEQQALLNKCGGGVCDEKEITNPELCPKDCEETQISLKQCMQNCIKTKSEQVCKIDCGIPVIENPIEKCMLSCLDTEKSESECKNECITPDDIEEPIISNKFSYHDSPFGLASSREINPFSIPENIVKNRMETIDGFFNSLKVSWNRDSPVDQLISWDNIEPEEGKFNFTGVDLYLSTANINTLAIVWPMAEWDQKTCHSEDDYFIRPCACACLDKGGSEEDCCASKGHWKGAPCDILKYQIFLEKLVERYDGDGIDDMPGLIMPIKYWEIINEPDLGNEGAPMPSDKSCKKEGGAFWRSSAKDLVELMKASYETIHRVCPDCKVTSPGFASINNDFTQEVLELGGEDYFDIFNFHSYPQDASYEGMAVSINKIRNGYGITKDIWLTETGNPGDAKAYENNKITKNEYYKIHSEFILKQYTIALSLGIKKIFWWNSWPNDINQFDSQGWKTLALNDMNGNKRPAYYTYKLMVEKLDYFETVETVKDGFYKFSFKNKDPIYVLWSDSVKTVDLSPYISSSKVRITSIIDEEGETQPVIEDVSINSIPIDETPIFIEEN
jgi:hypothetical protein